MMRKIEIATVFSICIALFAVDAFSQSKETSVFSDYLGERASNNFLKLSGLEFNSSAGYSYFSSNSGSFGMSYYMGHFKLDLARNLTLRWDVGVGMTMLDSSEYRHPEVFVPNVDLTYRAGENFVLRLQYQQIPWQAARFYPYR